MGKWGRYDKKYRTEWEHQKEFQGWLAKSEKFGNTHAYCKLCNVDIRAQKNDLIKHSQTSKHKANKTKISVPSVKQKAFISVVSKITKINEIKIAYFIACHSAIKSTDHLGELINQINNLRDNHNSRQTPTSTSGTNNVKIHRTKCTALIKNVISRSYRKELLNDICDSKYSIVVDESTDISTVKYMCLCVRYYSKSQLKIITDYLGIITVTETTADVLYDKFKDFISNFGLNLKNLIGLGTDGANNLCGKNHSLYALLKKDIPNLILVKCICHSLNICASKAVEVLPSSLEFQIKETYNWFSNSSLRKEKYKTIFRLINNEKEPKCLVQANETRWLSRYNAIERIINQYLELKTHFHICSLQEKCYTAQILSQMYGDKKNLIYFTSVQAILKEIIHLNLLFQSNNIDFVKAFEEIKCFISILLKKILKNFMPGDCIPTLESFNNLDETDFISTTDFILDINTSELSDINGSELFSLKYDIREFVISLTREVLKRLPENIKILEQIKYLSPTVCLNHLRPNFEELPLINTLGKDLSVFKMQYEKLLFYDWKSQFQGEKIPDDPVDFWIGVSKAKNAANEFLFFELSRYAISLLSLPVSNAVVERTFSMMNTIKSKIRNRLKYDTLDAILRIKVHSLVKGVCCNNFEASQDMVEQFTKDVYEQNTNENEDLNDDEEIEIIEIINLC